MSIPIPDRPHLFPASRTAVCRSQAQCLTRRALVILVLVLLVGPRWSPANAQQRPVEGVRSRAGLVVSESSHASLVGRAILRQGGNAVDAAVATAFALAVTWPEAGNIGGGGFMIVYPGQGRPPKCIEYREAAPASATATMFARSDGKHTHKIVGVPGTVRGLELAHATYGRLAWRDLVLPAAKLARDGFEIEPHLAISINGVLQQAEVRTEPRLAELARVYGKPDRTRWQPGERLALPDLAATLERIAEFGADGFYRGPVADLLIAEMQRGDGQITAADLADYRAHVREPARGAYRGHEIISAPPPSSGGTCLIESLNVLETFDLRSSGRFAPRTLHLITETVRRAYLDRARSLGDPDFVAIPRHLTAKEYGRQLALSIHPDRATASETLAPDVAIAGEPASTTHFSTIDRDGMAVANTYTLEGSWGSYIVVPGAGFLLNNEMGDFNWFPGETRADGQIGTAANQIAPHKRMLSSQTPTIVARDGRVVLVTGSPGGRTIINTVLDVTLNVVEFGMELPAAVAAPRMHHAWLPDELQLEANASWHGEATILALEAMGHRVTTRTSQGSAHSIALDAATGEYVGAADQRRGGLAASE